jgi:capsular polysaccharide biosynthesis protein
MNSKREEDDELEIDLLEIGYALWKKIWLIILAAIIVGAGAGVYSKVILMPVYRSVSTMFVLSKETTLTSLADLQIGSQLTNDYKVVITSRPVLQQVIDEIGLNMSYKELREMIEIENPSSTRILSIAVEDTDPVRAKSIADEVAETSSEYIADIMEMIPPKIIETGEVAEEPVSPNIIKNTLLGALAGAFAVCAVITLHVILNDSICTEEDVERYLELPVLAAIPDRTEENKKSRRQKKFESA